MAISYSFSNEKNTNNQIAQLKREMSGDNTDWGFLVHTRTVSMLFSPGDCGIQAKICAATATVESKLKTYHEYFRSAERRPNKPQQHRHIQRHKCEHRETKRTNSCLICISERAAMYVCADVYACVLVFELQFKSGQVVSHERVVTCRKKQMSKANYSHIERQREREWEKD